MVERHLEELEEISRLPMIADLSDQQLLEKFEILCTQLGDLRIGMSEAFNTYNCNGLRRESFVRYAETLFDHITSLQSRKPRTYHTMQNGRVVEVTE